MARNQYVEEILMNVKVNDTELNEIKKDFDKLKITEVLSPKAKEELKKSYIEKKKQLKEEEKIRAEMAKLEGIKGKDARKARQALAQAQNELNIGDALKDGIQKGLVEAGKKAWKAIQDVAVDVWNEAKQMMQDIASYSANSRMYSSQATSLKMSYGLSGSQAYAAQKASEMSGFGSFDEFVQNYAFATKETQEHWQELFEKYEKSYKQDEEIALAFQEFEIEWSEFKKEMAMELIDFFMENKDTIKTVMKGLIQFMEVGLEVFGGLLKWLGDGVRSDTERNQATSDILQNQVNNNRQDYSKTVSVSNTFNGVQSSDRTSLINAGNLTFEQVMKALL